jgi:small-conductance mechanosensitive channel
MQVRKKNNPVAYMPQEIRETIITERIYHPIDKATLQKYFPHIYQEEKHRLKKKKRK